MTRPRHRFRFGAALLAGAIAAPMFGIGGASLVGAAPDDGVTLVFSEGIVATGGVATYDSTAGGFHSIRVETMGPIGFRSLMVSVPVSIGFVVGAWDVDLSGANTTPRTNSPCPAQELGQRLEILQFEASGPDLQRFAARTSTRCPDGIQVSVVAWRATVALDVLAVMRTSDTHANARIGSSATINVEIANSGTTTLRPVFRFRGSAPPSVTLTPGTCGTSLPSGATCWFDVVFRPTDTSIVTASVQVVSESTSWWDSTGAMQVQLLTFNGRPAPPPGDALTPIDPVRLLDTRFGIGATGGAIAQSPLEVQIAGRGGIPVDATAVVANITVTEPTSSGFLTVWPTGDPRPLVSNLNFVVGDSVPNSALLTLGLRGAVDVFNSSGLTHVIIDIVGWLSPMADLVYEPMFAPSRLVDTRQSGYWSGAIGPGEERTYPLGFPGAEAVVLNITATLPTAATHLTVHGKNRFNARPNTSTLNLRPGETRANFVIVNLADQRELAVYNNSGATHVVIDIVGFLKAADDVRTAGRFVPLSPFRAVDSREGNDVFARYSGGGYEFDNDLGVGDLQVRAIVFNATATEPTSDGFLTLFPWVEQVSLTSTLNFVRGQTVPNHAWVRLPPAPDNLVGIWNGSAGTTHVVLDVQAVILG